MGINPAALLIILWAAEERQFLNHTEDLYLRRVQRKRLRYVSCIPPESDHFEADPVLPRRVLITLEGSRYYDHLIARDCYVWWPCT